MTCLKKLIPEVLMLIGILIVVGAVGHDEYMMEIGQYYPLHLTAGKILLGLVLMIPESLRMRHDR